MAAAGIGFVFRRSDLDLQLCQFMSFSDGGRLLYVEEIVNTERECRDYVGLLCSPSVHRWLWLCSVSPPSVILSHDCLCVFASGVLSKRHTD